MRRRAGRRPVSVPSHLPLGRSGAFRDDSAGRSSSVIGAASAVLQFRHGRRGTALCRRMMTWFGQSDVEEGKQNETTNVFSASAMASIRAAGFRPRYLWAAKLAAEHGETSICEALGPCFHKNAWTNIGEKITFPKMTSCARPRFSSSKICSFAKRAMSTMCWQQSTKSGRTRALLPDCCRWAPRSLWLLSRAKISFAPKKA